MIQVADEGTRAVPPAWVRDELGGATGSGIRVAVLDSGWDRSIHDPRVLPGTGFVDPDDDFALARNDDDHDVLGHGTACADVILSVAPDARIIPVKVFGKKLETSPGTLQAALNWAIEAGVQVINVSLGTRLKDWLNRLYLTCETARRQGIIVVAAGHNANDWSYPAIFENVIGVSAARFGSPYDFHYRAEEAMECVGWGVDRPVLWVGGERVLRHGTSFAAPGVAGIVALILERHPGAKLEDVREMLSRFAIPGGEEIAPATLPPPRQAASRAARKPRKRPAASPKPAAKQPKRAAAPAALDTTAPAKSATKPRKPGAALARPAADVPAPAKPAAKPRKGAAAPVATATSAEKKPRKRTTAPASDAQAPASAVAKPRKRAASAAVADTKQPKRTKAPATAAADDGAAAGVPAKRRRPTARAGSRSKA